MDDFQAWLSQHRIQPSLHEWIQNRDYLESRLRTEIFNQSLGVEQGDRVGTLCWNHYRHFEAYFGVPAIGGVLHTLNLRLHPNDLSYIASHAEEKVIIVDSSLLPLLEQFKDNVPSLQHVIVVPDDGPTPEDYLDYEQLISAESDDLTYAELDENDGAAMCYTSGTTGHPKGVMYSHRSIVLHTMASCMADALAISEHDRILPVVPMFHANAWGMPYDAVMTGASIIFPGPDLSPESLLNLMESERVTFSGGVPTIWNGILGLLDANPKKWDLSHMRAMVIGGSAAPPSMIDGYRERHGLDVIHAWGMTETDPLGSMAAVKSYMRDWPEEKKLEVKATQGYPIPYVEIRHVNDEGKKLAWDGQQMGELEVRGPWVTGTYYNNDEQQDRFTADGWFKTGDIVTINPDGYIRITDRSKDVIKSGGEWISSVDLENELMAHPKVMEAAVFAARHAKWDERPLAAIVLRPGESATAEEFTEYLAPKFAKFWLPDDYLFIDEVPKTSTGKFQKLTLRDQYGEYLVQQGKGG
jgi:fatty-acyl-CoA synthase